MLLLSSGLATGLLADEGALDSGEPQNGGQSQSQPQSLGGLVRDAPPESQQFEWVRAVEAQNDDGAVNERGANETGANEEIAATLRQNEIIREHLSELQTPIDQVVVSSYLSDQPTPKDRAEEVMNTKPPTRIGGAATGAILPDRYPISMYHRPLYFEQPNLERCGNTCGFFQNAISAALFFADTTLLPCRISQHRGQTCVRAGGDCPTCHKIPRRGAQSCLPLNPPSWAAEAAAGAGFSFLCL